MRIDEIVSAASFNTLPRALRSWSDDGPGGWIDENVDSTAVTSRSAESSTTDTYVENARRSRTSRAASVDVSTADNAAFAEFRAFNR